MGVTIINGLALRAHRAPGIYTTKRTDTAREIYAATAMTLRAPSRDDVSVDPV
jgi:hypothetical protein